MSARPLFARFARGRRGSVAVEFGFLATVLLMLTTIGIDLTNISALNREIERQTTQVAAAIVSCPASSTPGYTSCTTDSIQQYTDRKANLLVRLPWQPVSPANVSLAILQINEISNAIRVCAGTSTALDSDIQTRALAVLNDKDVAIVVVISMNYVPYFPKITKLFFGGAETNALRGYSIAVQVSNVKLCGN